MYLDPNPERRFRTRLRNFTVGGTVDQVYIRFTATGGSLPRGIYRADGSPVLH
jgi:hypothetical protein